MSALLLLVGLAGAALLVASLALAARGELGTRGPALAVSFLGMAGVSGETDTVSAGQGLSEVATALVLGGAVLTVAANWSLVKTVSIRTATIWPFAVAVWLFVVNALATPGTPLTETLLRAAPVATWMALAVLISTGLLTRESIAAAVCAAFGWACVLALLAPAPWGACSAFKCGPFGQILTGPFGNENYFGRLACLAAVSAFMVWRGRFKWVAPLAAFLVLYATASRTSQLALIVAVVIAAVVFGRARGNRSRHTWAAPWFAASTVCGIGLYLVYTAGDADFSNRGGIWNLGTAGLGGAWPVGRGISTWTTDVLERNFMHSEALLMIYSGGAVAIVLWGALLVGVFRGATSASSLCLAVVISVLGFTEVVWNPLAIDGTVVILLGWLAVIAPSAVGRPVQRLASEPVGLTGKG